MNSPRSLILVCVLLTLLACQQTEPQKGVSYSTVDGSQFVVGESYQYVGNGKFQHQKTVKWDDLEK